MFFVHRFNPPLSKLDPPSALRTISPWHRYPLPGHAAAAKTRRRHVPRLGRGCQSRSPGNKIMSDMSWYLWKQQIYISFYHNIVASCNRRRPGFTQLNFSIPKDASLTCGKKNTQVTSQSMPPFSHALVLCIKTMQNRHVSILSAPNPKFQ